MFTFQFDAFIVFVHVSNASLILQSFSLENMSIPALRYPVQFKLARLNDDIRVTQFLIGWQLVHDLENVREKLCSYFSGGPHPGPKKSIRLSSLQESLTGR